jgi:hypothetical protein
MAGEEDECHHKKYFFYLWRGFNTPRLCRVVVDSFGSTGTRKILSRVLIPGGPEACI